MNSAFGRRQTASGASRSIVALSGPAQRAKLFELLWAYASDRDVVFVESIERGYSRVRELTPDLIVVLAGMDDAPACCLLSMVSMDSDTSDIPVVTWMTGPEETEWEDFIVQMSWDCSSEAAALHVH